MKLQIPQFTNASTVTINGNSTINGQTIVSNTSYTVSPIINTLYTLVVINSIGVQQSASVTINVTPNTGWYGNIYMELLNSRGNTAVSYNYTIYKGSTTASTILVSNEFISNSSFNTVVSSPLHQLGIGDRLANNSSSFLVVINSSSGGDFRFDSLTNATLSGGSTTQASIIPSTLSDVRIRFSIETP